MAMNLKVLWSYQMSIFSAIFSSSDAKIGRADGWVGILLDKTNKDKKARVLGIDAGENL